MSDNFKYTKSMIEWRRNTVFSKIARGYSQADVAKELQLDPSTISLDVKHLKERARNELKTHLTERLPWEHARAMNGTNELVRRAHDILDKTTDPKMQMQTMTLLMQLYGSIMTLATDGGIVQEAMKKVEGLESNRNESPIKEEENKESNRGSSPSDIEEESVEPEEDIEKE